MSEKTKKQETIGGNYTKTKKNNSCSPVWKSL